MGTKESFFVGEGGGWLYLFFGETGVDGKIDALV